MPRQSRSSSSKNTSRNAKAVSPKKTDNNQAAKPSMASGLMGSIMTGMAFGAGFEFMRQLFRNEGNSKLLMPLLLSGVGTFGVRKFLLTNGPYKNLYTIGIFGGSFILIYNHMNKNNTEESGYEH